jgi:hypothetical protein
MAACVWHNWERASCRESRRLCVRMRRSPVWPLFKFPAYCARMHALKPDIVTPAQWRLMVLEHCERICTVLEQELTCTPE